MKEGFDGPPIGLRITRRDAQILSHLKTAMWPGMAVSLSDVARSLMRMGMSQYGISVVPEQQDLPERFSGNVKRAASGK
jgi:hypothetical protein